MGALYENLPPEMEAFAEKVRLYVVETFFEAHAAGMRDMADSLAITFANNGQPMLAEVVMVVKQAGLEELSKIQAERKGR